MFRFNHRLKFREFNFNNYEFIDKALVKKSIYAYQNNDKYGERKMVEVENGFICECDKGIVLADGEFDLNKTKIALLPG